MSTLMPFLYQTRTLQRLVTRRTLSRRNFSRTAASLYDEPTRPSYDSIPFENAPAGETDDGERPLNAESSITPSEAAVFKSIFDDIQTGRMPRSKVWSQLPESSSSQPQDGSGVDDAGPLASGSIVEQVRQARLNKFRDHVMDRYPSTLRHAAQAALNLYEFEDSNSVSEKSILEQEKEESMMRQERAKFDALRAEEKSRVDELMKSCETDIELWKVLEDNVFNIPVKLGISDKVPRAVGRRSKKNPKAKTEEAPATDAKYSMDVHGPLYPHYILTALTAFDTSFSIPSSYAFSILPRVKALGLTSYVLGVSTAFYARLARIHWERYGDATSALDMVNEMSSIGLQADHEVDDLLMKIRYDLHGCALGPQGPFVAAVMESPPYDAALLQRLEDTARFARMSMEESRDYR